MQAVGIGLDELVEVTEDKGRIVIEPVQQKIYDLQSLVNGITPQNLHEPLDFGYPEGKEIW
jgi:antitoxin MazE